MRLLTVTNDAVVVFLQPEETLELLVVATETKDRFFILAKKEIKTTDKTPTCTHTHTNTQIKQDDDNDDEETEERKKKTNLLDDVF